MGALEERIYEEILETQDGRSSCPECDWWVPAGMEYLFLDHYKEHNDLVQEVETIRQEVEN